MERVQEFSYARKAPFTERFTTVLPCFLTLLEREWRESSPLMSSEESALVRQAHRALGRLNEMQEGAP
ncbi:hypothetical protein AYO43_04400 [Nitrospira sp. SCGC AG-212-E16]|nr:hypothetical protein AYO43_04400 [Nitrospira sp. SCGC AG-212-E16]